MSISTKIQTVFQILRVIEKVIDFVLKVADTPLDEAN